MFEKIRIFNKISHIFVRIKEKNDTYVLNKLVKISSYYFILKSFSSISGRLLNLKNEKRIKRHS